MSIGSGNVLDRLACDEPCLGALFLSYAFDPLFFENHVLRAILGLSSDPFEHPPRRYYQEARFALQRVPVAVIVDAHQRQAGRRLPYDLLDVVPVVLHSKAVLLLFARHARMLIGSGNLTEHGYSGNTELFYSTDLDYRNPADAHILLDFKEHAQRAHKFAASPGTQFGMFMDELDRRLGPHQGVRGRSAATFLDSTKSAILEQVMACLPRMAVVDYVGMLAPFFERDGTAEFDASSVFAAFGERLSKDAVLDVGLSWDNPEYSPTETQRIEDGFGRLWTRTVVQGELKSFEYFTPESVNRHTLRYRDSRGVRRARSLDDVEEEVANQEIWMQRPPIIYAPSRSLVTADQSFGTVRHWLYPKERRNNGQVVVRPLHAKLMVIGYRVRGRRGSLLVMGSPNMSRSAMLLQAGAGVGNVELALAFNVSSALELSNVVPDLIWVPQSAIELRERQVTETAFNPMAIDAAIHEPRERTLHIHWTEKASKLGPWRISYEGTELASHNVAPVDDLVLQGFELGTSSAEVVLHVTQGDFPTPILVSDLAALPVGAAATQVGLSDLLQVLGRQMDAERAIAIAEKHPSQKHSVDALDINFGNGFSPTDVFKAWWGLADKLGDPSLSLQAFRVQLEGAFGAAAVWALLKSASVRSKLGPEAVWLYGAELVQALAGVKLKQEPARNDKRKCLSRFMASMKDDLCALRPSTIDHPWVKIVTNFYEGGSA